MEKGDKTYLGDGVYLEFSGYDFILTSENGIEVLDKIHLGYEECSKFLHILKEDTNVG